MAVGAISHANGAALVSAGLLSVLIFPVTSLGLLHGRKAPRGGAIAGSSVPKTEG